MCNLTSLAMTLAGLGARNPHPEGGRQFEDQLEVIRKENSYGERTGITALQKLAQHFGAASEMLYSGWTREKTLSENEFLSFRDQYLNQGYELLLSITGHIVRVRDVTEEGLVLDDPYGYTQLKQSIAKLNPTGKNYSYSKAHSFNPTNPKGQSGSAGKATVIPWKSVENHKMHWLMAVGGPTFVAKE